MSTRSRKIMFLRSRARPVRWTDNLTAISEPIVYKTWDPNISRFVTGRALMNNILIAKSGNAVCFGMKKKVYDCLYVSLVGDGVAYKPLRGVP
jgi:hypothetical protein